MPPRSEKYITPREAFRGIHVDCESLAKEPPALIGWACEFEFEQRVLDPRLELAAKGKDLRVDSISDALDCILNRCEEENRVFIAYTQAEKQTVDRHTDFRIGDRYRDAHRIARRWINRLHPEATRGEWRLKDLLEYIGFPWPTYLGSRKATKKIRYVAERSEGKTSYKQLSRGAKRHWTNLLEYNRIDCLGMRDLVMRAAAELAVAQEHGIVVNPD